MPPRLLDLFCGAGGAAMGYSHAGFEVVGVDIVEQPNYPFEFRRGDALAVLNAIASAVHDPRMQESNHWRFDAIHASPPCQAYSKTQRIRKREHPDLIGPTRELLNATGLPWVIENVPGAPLRAPVVLEGQMFDGLRTQRTRWFETNWPLEVPFLRSPRPAPNAKMGRKARAHEWVHVVGNAHSPDENRRAMGIDWKMSRAELSEAIPPAYTEFIGRQLAEYVENYRQREREERAMFTVETVTGDEVLRAETLASATVWARNALEDDPEVGTLLIWEEGVQRRTESVITWAGYIRHNRGAVTCPWEIWERLPDGRERFLAAYQTLAEAERNYR